jgi:hypothetical protein
VEFSESIAYSIRGYRTRTIGVLNLFFLFESCSIPDFLFAPGLGFRVYYRSSLANERLCGEAAKVCEAVVDPFTTIMIFASALAALDCTVAYFFLGTAMIMVWVGMEA